ncbi:MAG: hypothetical protein MN733_05620, partial [Nitrososphaera sp.]|nr:hypothetical protein [Nitrososphaera sp.]
YIEITCPDGKAYDALIQATEGLYTTRASCYGDKTIRIYFQAPNTNPRPRYIPLAEWAAIGGMGKSQ